VNAGIAWSIEQGVLNGLLAYTDLIKNEKEAQVLVPLGEIRVLRG
jgi:hypothetical protein